MLPRKVFEKFIYYRHFFVSVNPVLPACKNRALKDISRHQGFYTSQARLLINQHCQFSSKHIIQRQPDVSCFVSVDFRNVEPDSGYRIKRIGVILVQLEFPGILVLILQTMCVLTFKWKLFY
jgi:hypothetical protein